jgi:nitrite reductase (NADH) large subunit
VLPCDLLLVAVGIRPNVELARVAGLRVERGIVVDETMRTSVPEIFAAGDVCEFNRQVPGLWSVAVEQARVAALNATGGQEIYREIVPVTALKVVGVDLTSIGRFEPRAADEIVIALEDLDEHRYRKLVVAGGKIVGAILLGYPQLAPPVTAAVKEQTGVGAWLDALRAGEWDVLSAPGNGTC